MLKKFNKFIIENVEVLDPTIKPPVIKSKTGGDDSGYMLFFMENDKIYDNKISLVNDEFISNHPMSGKNSLKILNHLIETHPFFSRTSEDKVSTMISKSNVGKNPYGRLCKVDMSNEFVIAAKNQTKLELKLGEIYTLDSNQPLYTWLLENIEILY
tara:strand:- start:79271 stop:79738 length:468 start_codon:yes stop_codon:yes gene_type:complete